MAKRHGGDPRQRSEHGLSHEIYGRRGAGRDEAVAAGAPAAALASEEALTEATTAIVVVHGMGQQLEFQTLDEVERGLRRVDPAPGGRTLGGILRAKDGKPIPRIELELHGGADGERTVPIHAFECYWASLTEGRVTLRDVMSFLWHAGLGGLKNAGGKFERWMFGSMKPLRIEQATAFWLNCALIVLASLVALNTLIAAVGAARIVTAAEPAGEETVLTPALLSDLSVGMFILLIVAGICVACGAWTRSMVFFWLLLFFVAIAGPALLGVTALHRWPEWRERLAAGGAAGWPVFVVLTILLAIAAYCLRKHLRPNAVRLRTLAVVVGVLAIGVGIALALETVRLQVWQAAFFVLWGVLLGVSRMVRTLLVQYVGDVAVYVSPHRLDRFHDLRDEIKGCVGNVVQAVFDAKDDAGGHRYQRVFVVGHSLGSVAAYDVVNRMLLTDAVGGGRLAVRDRLKLLLTFGSPLDKTAFLFRRQAEEDAVTREVLAAVVQPMIHDDSLRERIPWLNVHSPKDIISGPLEFYDDPAWRDGRPPRVENVEDPDADVPIKAHVQYWENDLVFHRLHQAICAP